MSEQRELSGDDRLDIRQRLAYLVTNLRRNLRLGPGLRVVPYTSRRTEISGDTASPGRILTDAFIAHQLPTILAPRPVKVLEIGCGSGSLCAKLADLGYRGTYVGVDVQDRFNHAEVPGFDRRFILGDAHAFAETGPFDLVVSVSALEHIPDDGRLINALPGLVAAGGIELHIVPSGLGLPAYLWHGYRQYTSVSLRERFGADGVTVYGFGGLPSFLAHFLLITCGEMLSRLKVRQRFPKAYARLVDLTLRADAVIPWGPTMYAVIRQAPAP